MTGDAGEELALSATSALDCDAAPALMALVCEIEPPVQIESVACTPAGEVELTYRREGPHHVGDEAGHLCGAYIQGHSEAGGALAGLEVKVIGSDGEPRATWHLEEDWIEAHQTDRIDDDELMDRVSTTVEVI